MILLRFGTIIFIGREHDFCFLRIEGGWLSQKNFVGEDDAFDCEVQSVNTLVSVVDTVNDKLCGLERIIDAKQCSFLKTLFMVTCFVVRCMFWQRYERQLF